MTMLNKDPSMRWISPMLVVKDVDASMKAYAQAFGFEPGETMLDEDGNTTYGSMQYKGQMAFMLMPEKSWGSPAVTPATSNTYTPVSLYVYADNVNSLFTQAKSAGMNILSEPADMEWGDRVTQMQDADGHTWSFATRVAEYQKPPQETATA